jgi:hypothetical protein
MKTESIKATKSGEGKCDDRGVPWGSLYSADRGTSRD